MPMFSHPVFGFDSAMRLHGSPGRQVQTSPLGAELTKIMRSFKTLDGIDTFTYVTVGIAGRDGSCR